MESGFGTMLSTQCIWPLGFFHLFPIAGPSVWNSLGPTCTWWTLRAGEWLWTVLNSSLRWSCLVSP